MEGEQEGGGIPGAGSREPGRDRRKIPSRQGDTRGLHKQCNGDHPKYWPVLSANLLLVQSSPASAVSASPPGQTRLCSFFCQPVVCAGVRLLCQPAVIHHGLTGQPATQLAGRQTASQPEGLGRVVSQPAARPASLLQRDGRSEDDRCASAGRARPRHTLYSLQLRVCTIQCVVYSVQCAVCSV